MARQDRQLEATEEMLIEAWRLLMRLPDRDRGWLASGQRSAWPAMVKDIFADYADLDATPRLQLGRREMAIVGRVFLDPGCLVMEIAEANRRLVALVLARKAGRMPGGFRWEDVWEAMGGRSSHTTTDALRVRYERVLARLTVVQAQREAA